MHMEMYRIHRLETLLLYEISDVSNFLILRMMQENYTVLLP